MRARPQAAYPKRYMVNVSMSEKKRSIGVTIFAYWNIVLGIIGILLFISGSAIIIFSAPLMIIIGFGLLKLKEWARKFVMVLTILDYLSKWALVFIISKNLQVGVWYLYQTRHIISLFMVVITIFYFTRSKVKEQFAITI